jgi:hypothetical protein
LNFDYLNCQNAKKEKKKKTGEEWSVFGDLETEMNSSGPAPSVPKKPTGSALPKRPKSPRAPRANVPSSDSPPQHTVSQDYVSSIPLTKIFISGQALVKRGKKETLCTFDQDETTVSYFDKASGSTPFSSVPFFFFFSFFFLFAL